MAYKRTLAQRIFNIGKLSNCRISSPSSISRSRSPSNPSKPHAPDPGDNAVFRRFLHRQAAISPERRSIPMTENLMEKIRSVDNSRLRLDGLSPPRSPEKEVTAEDVRKLLRLAQLEGVKKRIREIEKSVTSYSEFVKICGESCGDSELGLGFAKVLDESGFVIVLGKTVFLKPDQVTRAIHRLMPVSEASPNDPRKKEFKELEQQKAAIDKKAEGLVRRELWAGLGFLMVQTAGFMRLTFWELTWDVMEPICFYVTSMYFMAGYAFFLRTAREPSFEGFFESRFRTKQMKLMKNENFDIARYNELKKALYPQSSASYQDAPLIKIPGKTQFQAIDH